MLARLLNETGMNGVAALAGFYFGLLLTFRIFREIVTYLIATVVITLACYLYLILFTFDQETIDKCQGRACAERTLLLD